MASAPVHFLWLMPELGGYWRLARIIQDLSARTGMPPFEPHVTLLGRIAGQEAELVERTRRLAQGIPSFAVTGIALEHGEQFFRCVYLAVLLAPALETARTEAERHFGRDGNAEPYRPHLSLVYGSLPPELRNQLCMAADGALPQRFVAARLQLVAGAPDYRDWRTVASFGLITQTRGGPHPPSAPSSTD